MATSSDQPNTKLLMDYFLFNVILNCEEAFFGNWRLCYGESVGLSVLQRILGEMDYLNSFSQVSGWIQDGNGIGLAF